MFHFTYLPVSRYKLHYRSVVNKRAYVSGHICHKWTETSLQGLPMLMEVLYSNQFTVKTFKFCIVICPYRPDRISQLTVDNDCSLFRI